MVDEIDQPCSTSDSRWEIDRSWEVTTARDVPRALGTVELAGFQCLVLLGAAGAGKTVEAKRLGDYERKSGIDVHECRLAQYAGSSLELTQYLSELSKFADPNTVYHLDALDEAMIPLRRAWSTIGMWVETELRGSGAALRITCRSAVWPGQLASVLKEFAGESYAEAHLRPLTDSDISAAASATGVDAGDFRLQVQLARAESLAQRPARGGPG